MKITFVAPRFHTNQHFWVKTLQERGHEVTFLVDRKAEVAEHYETIEPIVVETHKLPKILCILIDLFMKVQGKLPRERLHTVPQWKFLKNHLAGINAADIVIVRDVGSTLSLTTFLICKLNKIPCILYTQHPLEDREKTPTRFLQLIGLAPKYRITPIRKNTSHTYNESTKAFYVPLISDFNFKISEQNYSNPPLKVLFIGKFGLRRKNPLLLLKAINLLKRDGFVLQVTLIGYANQSNPLLQEIMTYINNNDLGSVVTIKRNITFKEITNEYKAHDIFVLPSINEPFSVSTLEAMSHALPVIISDTNGSKYCVQHNKTGYVVQSNSVGDLRDHLEQFLINQDKVKEMGTAANQYIKKEHSPEVFYDYFFNALDKVI